MPDFASICQGVSDANNNDYIGISDELHCTCYAVVDGKGMAGASEIAAKSILEDFKAQSDITTDTLPTFLDNAHKKLLDVFKEGPVPEGCSAAVLLTNGELAVWAHIGDCRIYHLQDNMLYEITPDHSEAYSRYEVGEIRYPKIRIDRTRRKLYRLMGGSCHFEPSFSAPEVVRKNDSFLICTDGFWENIHERQIEKTLKKSGSAEEWLLRMKKIVNKNRQSGKYTKIQDDYSAVTIKI